MTKPTSPETLPSVPARSSLTARLDERFVAPVRNAAFARRTWFSVTVAAIVLLHGALLAFLLWRDKTDSAQLAQLQETPIEVVVEQPQAQPPAPQQQQTPQQPPEKPATSAPRAENDEKVDRKEAEDKETHAPKTATPAPAAPPQPTEAKAEPEKTEADKTEKTEAEAKPDAPKQPEDKKEAEALDKLTPPEPPKKPAKLAQAKPKPRAKTELEKLAGASDTPDYTFAKPTRKKSKVSGGSEDNRYLAVVYGMITQGRGSIPEPGGEWSVAVSFQVDGHGNLIGIQVTERSGYREVDMAAVQAVEDAAPFPPPPSGGVTGLVARLRSSADPRAAMMQ